MKKSFVVVLATVFSAGAALFFGNESSVASMNYECWTYVNGHPDKMTHISANSRSEAESLVQAKFRDLGAKWDYIKCK